MTFIPRTIQNQIKNQMFQGKVIIIYGARQVGKTTLIKKIEKNSSKEVLYLNCDEPDIRQDLINKTSTELKTVLGDAELIIIDEAQRVENIGLTLKLIVDNFSEKQIIATGSSSFDLSNEVKEPLTGRKREFHLYPFSMAELKDRYSQRELNRLLEQRMIYGFYPEVVKQPNSAKDQLKEITESYLYKDILEFQRVKKPNILTKLLQALALQIGSEVSYNELSNLVGVSRKTIIRYVNLLEKAFVIFRLPPYSRNLRKEISSLRKVYFYDLGVRNMLINNLNPLNLRQDVGALWENFLISERIKRNKNTARFVNSYFWRTHQQAEVDYLEGLKGRLEGYEFKWGDKQSKAPKQWLETYSNASYKVINKNNYLDFII